MNTEPKATISDCIQVDSLAIKKIKRKYIKALIANKSIIYFFWLVGPFIPIVILWEIMARSGIFSEFLFPSPKSVFLSGVNLLVNGDLLKNTLDSTFRLFIGFFVATLVAIPLGVLMGLNRYVARFFDPLINLTQAIPGLAWIPLALVWFGAGFKSMTFIIFMAVFFPVIFNTLGGVRGTNQTFVWAVLTLGGDKWNVLKEVVFPGALPSIVIGIRLGMGYGWRAVIAAEMIAAASGLGYMIFDARNWLDTPVVIVGMVVMGLIWLTLDRIVLKPVERKTIEKWGLVSRF